MSADSTLALESFIQAVQSQLDNAQTAMAMKAQNLNLPLTFAIKDISMDLRAHVEFARAEIRIRPAGPGDQEASTFHLVFTAITRPMIDENAIAFSESPHDRSLDDLKDDLSDEERRRLEWIGVRTVGKLRELQQRGGERAVGRITSLPVDRLRRALERATAPLVEHVLPARSQGEDAAPLIRVRGRNLMTAGVPRVTIGGEPVRVVRADENEVVIAPLAHQMSGELLIETTPDSVARSGFDLRPHWSAGTPASGEPS